MPSPQASLDELRREIDEIDDAIHDLLMRRGAIVERIGRVKGPGAVYLRPAREARILDRIAERHRGGFPLPVVLRIWREMLSGFTRMQGPFAIAVAAADGQHALRDLARDHFGSTTPMTMVGAPLAAIRAVTEGAATVAVVPWPQDDEPQPWWRALMSGDAMTPRVFARLPVVAPTAGTDDRRALALGRIPVEPTGRDHALIGLELAETISRSRLKQALDGAGLPVVAFWNGPAPGAAAAPQLVEIADHVGPGDARLAALADRLGPAGLGVYPIGGFAMPIDVNEAARRAG